MDPLLREFLGEAEELVEVLAGDLEALRARRQDGRTRRELVARIFRHVHTLKGSSASLELAAITELAHEFETLLDSLRLGRTSLDNVVLDAFDETIATISQLLRVVAAEEQPVAPRLLVEQLRDLAHGSESEKTRSNAARRVLSSLPDKIAGTLNAHEGHRLYEALNEGAVAFTVEANFALETFDERFRELSNALNEWGEIISTQPGVSTVSPDQVSFRIVLASQQSASQLRERLAPFGAIEVRELVSGKAQVTTRTAEDSSHAKEPEIAVPLSIAPLAPLVRIDLAELDQLITTTHDLFTDTMSALEQASSVDHSADAIATELKIRTERIRRRFEVLEEALSGIRMVSLDRTLARAVRAGVVVARATGKEIDFEIEGGEARLDKFLVDAIADPLLHILRNAVDHGIESPRERASNGKRVRGRIKLEALVEDGRMRLRIIDDGRGIDPKRVTRAAIDRGMIKGNTEVSGEESLRIIFAPGFSTAEIVSRVSGRGVGLDVVERALKQLGGEIQVQSEVGVGTTFELLLPHSNAFVPDKPFVSEAE